MGISGEGAVPPPGYTFIGITVVPLRKGNDTPGPVAASVYQKN